MKWCKGLLDRFYERQSADPPQRGCVFAFENEGGNEINLENNPALDRHLLQQRPRILRPKHPRGTQSPEQSPGMPPPSHSFSGARGGSNTLDFEAPPPCDRDGLQPDSEHVARSREQSTEEGNSMRAAMAGPMSPLSFPGSRLDDRGNFSPVENVGGGSLPNIPNATELVTKRLAPESPRNLASRDSPPRGSKQLSGCRSESPRSNSAPPPHSPTYSSDSSSLSPPPSLSRNTSDSAQVQTQYQSGSPPAAPMKSGRGIWSNAFKPKVTSRPLPRARFGSGPSASTGRLVGLDYIRDEYGISF